MATNHQSSAPQTNLANPQPEDEVLEQLYKERAEYAAKFQYDLWGMYQDLLEAEKKISLPRINP